MAPRYVKSYVKRNKNDMADVTEVYKPGRPAQEEEEDEDDLAMTPIARRASEAANALKVRESGSQR